VWQRYNRILSQRNVLLKQSKRAELASWNQQLSQVCEEFDCLRTNYVDQLIPIAQQYFEQLMDLKGVKFHYQNGWAQGVGFSEALASNIENDLKLGFTQRGPHRADLVMKIDGRSAAQYLSGGQQKLAACALMLAQASLYSQKTGRHCLILVDDLPAELDSTHRATFINLLDAMGGQAFITATDPVLLDFSAYKSARMFHVEHGSIISK
jgi:DNA replication and repair protein RecF